MASVAIAAVGLLLGGCAAGTSAASMGMMGAPSGVSTNPSAPGVGTMHGAVGFTHPPMTCAAPRSLPGSTVTATLVDLGMTEMMGGVAPLGGHMMLRAAPASATAGQVSMVVSNLGWRTHELVVLPLADGQAAGQRVPGADGRVDETGSLGEVSNRCAAGVGDGLGAGAVGWTTLILTPGRYELVCNLPNHYANGMHQLFVVT